MALAAGNLAKQSGAPHVPQRLCDVGAEMPCGLRYTVGSRSTPSADSAM
jgi:hypothetical protein